MVNVIVNACNHRKSVHLECAEYTRNNMIQACEAAIRKENRLPAFCKQFQVIGFQGIKKLSDTSWAVIADVRYTCHIPVENQEESHCIPALQDKGIAAFFEQNRGVLYDVKDATVEWEAEA